MGKMKQVAMMVQDKQSHQLKTMIETSERAGRNEVYFLGKTYSMQDAKQILMFMQDEERKIHRNKQSTQ
jgi:NCAIR mutase (PurE)-related protein